MCVLSKWNELYHIHDHIKNNSRARHHIKWLLLDEAVYMMSDFHLFSQRFLFNFIFILFHRFIKGFLSRFFFCPKDRIMIEIKERKPWTSGRIRKPGKSPNFLGNLYHHFLLQQFGGRKQGFWKLKGMNKIEEEEKLFGNFVNLFCSFL